MDPSPASHPILFFDGECGRCARIVAMALRADRRAVLRFAPLQGETARRLLPPLPGDPADWTAVLLDGRGIHRGADAVIEAGRRLGGAWSALRALRLLPRGARDALYRGVARGRKRGACGVPAGSERERFLP